MSPCMYEVEDASAETAASLLQLEVSWEVLEWHFMWEQLYALGSSQPMNGRL